MVPGAGPAPAAARPLRGPFRAARRGLLRRPCRGKAAPHAGAVRGARDRRRRKRRKPRGERPESGPGGGAAVLGPADGGAEPGCGTAIRGVLLPVLLWEGPLPRAAARALRRTGTAPRRLGDR